MAAVQTWRPVVTTSPNPNAVVVDANLIVHALLPGDLQKAAQQQLTAWRSSGIRLHAPSLWRYEVVSALNKSVHFGRLTDAEAQRLLSLIESFGVELHLPDAALWQSAYNWTRKLNRASAYDSFYVALAESLNCRLWTMDQRLANAANVDWVRLAGNFVDNNLG